MDSCCGSLSFLADPVPDGPTAPCWCLTRYLCPCMGELCKHAANPCPSAVPLLARQILRPSVIVKISYFTVNSMSLVGTSFEWQRDSAGTGAGPPGTVDPKHLGGWAAAASHVPLAQNELFHCRRGQAAGVARPAR